MAFTYPKSDPRSRITTSLDFKVFETLRGETDRAAALLGAAYVDNYLTDMFRVKLHEDAPRKLFEDRGPLWAFANKIDLAYGLGWLSTDVWADLHVVRKIRNDFAHKPDHLLSFGADSIRDRTANLKAPAKWMTWLGPRFDPLSLEQKAKLDTPRGRFECAVAEATAFIMKALGHGTLIQGGYPTSPPRPE